MSRFWYAALLLGIVSSQPASSSSKDDYIDYSKLNHDIQLSSFRGGNHDQSGVNDYYFQVSLYALAILKEERKKEFKDRLKILRDVGEFAQLQLPPLSFWQKPSNVPSLRIKGEDVRELMSEAMRTFKITENRVSIRATVRLYEANKQFIFFGDDKVIGSTSYYVIPETLPHRPKIENAEIEIFDEFGTHVKLATRFDELDPKKKRK